MIIILMILGSDNVGNRSLLGCLSVLKARGVDCGTRLRSSMDRRQPNRFRLAPDGMGPPECHVGPYHTYIHTYIHVREILYVVI
jgi:hypothetical protein